MPVTVVMDAALEPARAGKKGGM